MKKDVQKEILAILDEKIDNEINAMEGFYTVAEIAKEVLLQVGGKSIKKENIIKTFWELWNKLGDIPVNTDDEIETKFLHFEIGTDKFEIWHWFEDEFDVTLGEII